MRRFALLSILALTTSASASPAFVHAKDVVKIDDAGAVAVVWLASTKLGGKPLDLGTFRMPPSS